MHLITNYQYHVTGRRWNFFVNGTIASHLINAALYDDQQNQYRYREPFIYEEKHRFVLLGDGNLETIIDGLPQEIAYKILQNVQTFQTYVILSSAFTSEFELVEN
jgi:hypothetical protein